MKDDRLSGILDLTKKLISIKTTYDNPKLLKGVLLEAKMELGEYTVEKFLHNGSPSMLFYNQKTRPEKFKVIYNAHLDVVPGTDRQFIPFEKDGKLYSRGAYDMKAAAAVMILLFKELAPTLSYTLGLQLTTDEELSGENGTKYQLDCGVRSEFAITGECGSNFSIVHEAKTVMVIKLIASGVSSHGAYPWRGKNAILIMNNTIDRLMENYLVPVKETHNTTINVARIETNNTAYNKVPDDCTAYLDVRYPTSEQKIILNKIRIVVPPEIKLEVISQTPGHYTNPDSKYIKLLQKAGKNILGKNISVIKQFATSDARFYSAIGCDAVEFGPIGGGQHQNEEWVDIISLEQYYEILKKFLLSLN